MTDGTTGRLANKRCLITGGARGIGLETAKLFVAEGAKVLITDILTEDGEAAAKDIGAIFAEQDVTSETRWAEIMTLAEQQMGGLDVLVNNAGFGGLYAGNTPEDTELEHWRRFFTINVESVFMGCRAAMPLMAGAGGGSIINLSSVAALIPTPFIAAYGASKAAVAHLTKSVALHCATSGYKIRCNSVHPGQMGTAMNDGIFEHMAKVNQVTVDQIRADFMGMIPLGEFGTTEDVAFSILHLASDESKHVTGTQVVVDGGMTLVG